ncbi:hypothetical protein ACFT38_28565 [Streptomyces sp. NPDC056975]|uniref:hypothetical protein n=1 Tax=Streptomyces sp. NPDC056975 TaxID=3345985 RepID=UPI00362B6B61
MPYLYVILDDPCVTLYLWLPIVLEVCAVLFLLTSVLRRRWDAIVPDIAIVLAAGVWLLTVVRHWHWWLACPAVALLMVGGKACGRHRETSTAA